MAMTYTQQHKQNTVIVVLEKKNTETLEHVHLHVSNVTVMLMHSPHWRNIFQFNLVKEWQTKCAHLVFSFF